MTYEVLFRDQSVDLVDGADAYQQEGQMTTFFRTGQGRTVIDCWSTRVASFRTSEVMKIRSKEACAMEASGFRNAGIAQTR